MLAKLLQEHLDAVGAKDESEFPAKMTAFVAAAKQLEKVMAESSDLSAVVKRLDAIEAFNKTALTEARVSELVTAGVAGGVTAAMTTWAGSAEGKKLIGAEASRITAEAMAAVGTVPVKPAPAPATSKTTKELIAAGKFEEAWAQDESLQAEFSNAKVYAAYAKAEAEGRIATK